MEEGKGHMLAQVIQTTVNATFLLLAAILIYDRWDNNNNDASVNAAKKEMQDVMFNNVSYLEDKINRVASNVDAYQVGINGRVYVLENRMMSLEARSKSAARVSNINTNTINK